MLSVVMLIIIMLSVTNKPFMLSVIMLSVTNKPFMLSVIYAQCHKTIYAECRYAECHHAECRGANAHVRSDFIPSLKITLVSYSRQIFTALAANLIISESILI